MARAALAAAAAVSGRVATAAMAVSALALILMVTLVTVEVVARNLLNVSTLVADEMAAYFLVALTFLGLAPTLRDGGFIRIDTYLERASGRVRRALEIGIYLVAVAYAALLDWFLWSLALDAFRLGTTSIQVTRTPLWIPQSVMALGGLLLLVELLARLGLLLGGAIAPSSAGAKTGP